jgi:cell division septation protein DedD
MAAFKPIVHRAVSTAARVFLLILPAAVILLHGGQGFGAGREYGIQVGAYQDPDNAAESVNHLKRLGYDAFHRRETVKGKGEWHRVYIGRYSTRDQAEEEARVLRELDLVREFEIRTLESRAEGPGAGPEAPPDQDWPDTRTPGESESMYLLHVSSFRERARAEREARNLDEAGRKAFYAEEELAGGRWFRVYIGGFETEKEARRAGEELKGRGTVSYYRPVRVDRGALPGMRR